MTVYIAVDGFGGERGEVRVKTEFLASPIHRLTVVANWWDFIKPSIST